jgi:hypothetical protein
VSVNNALLDGTSPPYEHNVFVFAVRIVHDTPKVGVHHDASAEVCPLLRGETLRVRGCINHRHDNTAVFTVNSDYVAQFCFVGVRVTHGGAV